MTKTIEYLQEIEDEVDSVFRGVLRDAISDIEDAKGMITWAYSKLRNTTFSKQEDALMLDYIKMYLQS